MNIYGLCDFIKKEFQKFIEKTDLKYITSKSEPSSTGFSCCSLIYKNDFVEIALEYKGKESGSNILIYPFNYKLYKDRYDDLREIVNEEMIVSVYNIMRVKEEKLLQEYNSLRSSANEAEETMKILFHVFQKYCNDILKGDYSLFGEVNRFLEKEEYDRLEPDYLYADEYWLKKDDKLIMYPKEDYQKYLKDSFYEHKKIIAKICDDIYSNIIS